MNTVKTTYYSSANKITHEEWLDTEYCNCSKPVFKYHDVTNNVFVLKCKNGTGNLGSSNSGGVNNLIESFENVDINPGTTSKSKKTKCTLFEVYFGEEYSYTKQNKLSVAKKQTKKENNQNLKDRLEILFDYAKVNTINDRINLTIQEINYIVKFKLHRFTIGNFQRNGFNVSESLNDYRERILSRPIIDKSIKYSTKKKNNENKSHFITDLESEYSNSESEQESESNDSGSEGSSEDTGVVSEIESIADYEDYGYCSDDYGSD